MRRFHCVPCGRVVRVRRMPDFVSQQYADNPILRVGRCQRCARGAKSVAEVHGRVRTHNPKRAKGPQLVTASGVKTVHASRSKKTKGNGYPQVSE